MSVNWEKQRKDREYLGSEGCDFQSMEKLHWDIWVKIWWREWGRAGSDNGRRRTFQVEAVAKAKGKRGWNQESARLRVYWEAVHSARTGRQETQGCDERAQAWGPSAVSMTGALSYSLTHEVRRLWNLAGRALNLYQNIWRRSLPTSFVPGASPARAKPSLELQATGPPPHPTTNPDCCHGNTWKGNVQASLGSQLLGNCYAGPFHLNLSLSQFSHLWNGDNNGPYLLRRITWLNKCKGFTTPFAHSRSSKPECVCHY